MGLSDEDREIVKKCGILFDRNTSDEEVIRRVINFLKNENIEEHMRIARKYGKEKIFENVQDRYLLLYNEVVRRSGILHKS